MEIYKVYVHTEKDPAVSEVVVAAVSEEAARARALDHVKKSNPHKGDRTPEESQVLTRILFVKKAGVSGCLVIHRIPVEVFNKTKDIGELH